MATETPKRTMLGLSPIELGLAPPQTTPQAEPAPAGQVAPPGKLLTKDSSPPPGLQGGRSRTILGLPLVPQTEGAGPVQGQAPSQPPAQVAAPVPSQPAAQPRAQAPRAGAGVDLSPQSKRTILGAGLPADVAAALAANAQAANASAANAPAAPAPAAEPAAFHSRSFDAVGAGHGEPQRVGDRPRSFTPVTESPGYSEEEFSAPKAPRSKGPLLLVLGLLLACVLGGLALWFATRSPAFSARVVQVEGGGDALQVEVPDATPGTKVRFSGVELPLEAGRAAFPLSADALKLGENVLSVAVVDPSGSVSASEIKLAVDYRVRTDLTALLSDPPSVNIVVDAVPGSRLTIDGEFLALGTDGKAVKKYPVPAQAGARFELAPSYRVEPPNGTPVEGILKVSLPLASMQVDRPGADVVTDQALIEVAGAVEEGAEVSVDGRPVQVKDGRFLHRADLPQPGDYTLRVIARASGKAPRIEEVRVKRVTDLTLAAASFQADASITYGKLMQNPVTYKGQKVAFDGRVYNVEVSGGRSVIQILALNCPSSARCPLWVEYPQATEATVDSWVRVLGTVTGEQEFQSKQGGVQTVPSIAALYVLKLVR